MSDKSKAIFATVDSLNLKGQDNEQQSLVLHHLMMAVESRLSFSDVVDRKISDLLRIYVPIDSAIIVLVSYLEDSIYTVPLLFLGGGILVGIIILLRAIRIVTFPTHGDIWDSYEVERKERSYSADKEGRQIYLVDSYKAKATALGEICVRKSRLLNTSLWVIIVAISLSLVGSFVIFVLSAT